MFVLNNTQKVGFAVSASPSDPNYKKEMVNFSNTYQNYKIKVEIAGSTNSLGVLKLRVYMNYYDKETNTLHKYWDKNLSTAFNNADVNIS